MRETVLNKVERLIVSDMVSEACQFESGKVFTVADCPSFSKLPTSKHHDVGMAFHSRIKGFAEPLKTKQSGLRQYCRN